MVSGRREAQIMPGVPPEFLDWLRQNYSAFDVQAWITNFRFGLTTLEDDPQFQFWMANTPEGQALALEQPSLQSKARAAKEAEAEAARDQQLQDYLYEATSPSDFIARMTQLGINPEDMAKNYKVVYGGMIVAPTFEEAAKQFQKEEAYRQLFPKLQEFLAIAQNFTSPEQLRNVLESRIQAGQLTQNEAGEILKIVGSQLGGAQARKFEEAVQFLPGLNTLRGGELSQFLTPEDWAEVAQLPQRNQVGILGDRARRRQREEKRRELEEHQRLASRDVIARQQQAIAERERMRRAGVRQEVEARRLQAMLPPSAEPIIQSFLEQPGQPATGTRLRSFIEAQIPGVVSRTDLSRRQFFGEIKEEKPEEVSLEMGPITEEERLRRLATQVERVTGTPFGGDIAFQKEVLRRHFGTEGEFDPLRLALKAEDFAAQFMRRPGAGIVGRLQPAVRRF